eukprot:TRINITY_DN11378_c0_g2_i2.p1 TRINITY_DN11378_c0_g2~~TRINITY_DN11378_c0_g2_i2.p1  ORF type:complete len:244 (+),score=66.71 TRINITY_DN11378_c0_g2_i2:524-1255(+)
MPSTDLVAVLQELTPRLAHLQLTVENLNTQRWLPRKDDVANRVVAGQLQLSPGTVVFLDETGMSEGQLQTDGVKAVKGIDTMICDGVLPCQCNFYDVKLPVELSYIALTDKKRSFSKSVSINVPIKPDGAAAAAARKAVSDLGAASISVVEAVRLLLGLVTRIPKPLVVPDAVTKQFGTDFAAVRQQFQVQPDTAHSWLALARACCLWHGEQTLTPERWQTLLHMERERLGRLNEEGLLGNAA